MGLRTINMALSGLSIEVSIEGPNGETTAEDDYREVNFKGVDQVHYRGVFFNDINAGAIELPCRFDDNQIIFVPSLSDAAIEKALTYIIKNKLEPESLEVTNEPTPAPCLMVQPEKREPPLVNASDVETRVNFWIRSAVSLMRSAGVARSKEDVIRELGSRGEYIVNLIEEDESKLM